MKQIVVISGKGGTGKTVLTASFAALAKNAVFADCDVDAADLHLLLKPEIKERHEFRSGKTAKIDKKLCKQCGKCITVCRFNAISDDFTVDPISCEGCGICSLICPVEAIRMG
ncbi:MAG: 4Fe-4S binding protein [bacterium]|nr:4Fe-4S binding protein [bacterium]